MAIIYLTRGFETIVDDDLYEELNSYNWYASGLEGRPARRLKGESRKLIYIYHQILHVLPWVISLNKMCVDHLDGDPLNNKRDNIQLSSLNDNARNTIRHKFREGTSYDSTHNKYKAYIDCPDQPRLNIGTFISQEAASTALAKAKKELGIEDN